MEKERGMQSLPPTSAQQEFPQLQRLPFCSPANQGLVADYLAHLRARHYAPATEEGTIRALKSFAVLLPEARRTALYQDLTQTRPDDIDAGIEASFQPRLAPGTIATRRRVVQGFSAFLRDQGDEAQSPIRLPRHRILVPQDLPRPMGENSNTASGFYAAVCGGLGNIASGFSSTVSGGGRRHPLIDGEGAGNTAKGEMSLNVSVASNAMLSRPGAAINAPSEYLTIS
jgi:hypothetical protein